jgi:hypothetical protein
MCYSSYEEYRRYYRKNAERNTEGRRTSDPDERFVVWSKADDSRLWSFIARHRETEASKPAAEETHEKV